MDKSKYKHVSIPDKLIDEIDNFIKENKELDFRSMAQVVIFALRYLFTNRKKK